MPPANRVPMQAYLHAIRLGRFPWWYPEGAEGLTVDYYVYATDFTPLGASATVANSITISGEAAFVVLAATMVETDTANTTFLPNMPLLVDLSDTGSGRHFSNTPVAASNWFGTAEEPKYWDVPRVIPPNSTFSVGVQNLEATARNVRVAFHGFRVYGFRPR